MSKRRVSLAIGVILAAFALVLGFSSTSAPAGVMAATKLVITSTSPSHPIAGQDFRINFQLQKGGMPLQIKDVGCHAQIGDGKGVPVKDQGITNGTDGHCTWHVPSSASGKTLDGFVAAVRQSNGVTFFHGFDLPIS
jgi:hypothetical protein